MAAIGKAGLTSRVKWTTSDDDFDISIAMVGHGTDRLGQVYMYEYGTQGKEKQPLLVGTESREENEFGVETRDKTRFTCTCHVWRCL